MNGLRITLAAGAAAAMALLCTPAHADEQSGIAAGFRTGYAIPFGAAKSGTSLGTLEGGKIPFVFDLGYRFSPHFYLGGFFEYGIVFTPVHTCGGTPGQAESCEGSDLRGGIDFQYHFSPDHLTDPWVGLGIGYEAARTRYELQGEETSNIFYGFEYIDLQAGLDLHVSKTVPFGPFVDLSFGEFSHESYRDPAGDSQDVPMQSKLHEWLTLGMRAQFNL
jgi:hypothetical protein